MGTETVQQHASSLRDHLQVVRRRKWIILQAAILVPLAAMLLSLRQSPLYQASAEVLLSHQNLATSLTNTQDPTIYQQADRIAQTQADLARVPRVAENVRKALRLRNRSAADILAASSVSAKQNADLLVFQVRDGNRALAAKLAAEYARQFTIYRRKLDTAALERARREVANRADGLRASGDHSSALYASLVTKEQQLRTMEALQTSNSFVVRSPRRAAQVRPQPARNGFLGFALGLLFGICLAFLWEALDTRVRSAKEIGERLGKPLLARLPEPPRRLRAADRLVMLAEPNGVEAEAFRMLRTNLEFANLERDAHAIMVTSALEAEGKSTTVANLALALARTGKRVVLVDLDLRRPYLDRFFDLGERPGLTDVALGRVSLERALTPLAITEPRGDEAEPEKEHTEDGHENGNGNGNGNRKSTPRARGMLEVLPSGPIPPDTGEFVGSQKLAGILDKLRKRADVVLIDAPPLLHVGDAMTLSARVDALLVVCRLNVVRRPVLNELARVLEACPAPTLGYAAAGVEADEEYGSTYGGYYYQRRSRQPQTESVR
jgi:non-specific protein-tyrosine kinase